ncbi:MAG TPA: hypothetical protein VK186_18015 [Candidatus Deferrimicrobium sp.]|nr:hypothetical protein [Candidatus Deferrimicrobium sp.]
MKNAKNQKNAVNAYLWLLIFVSVFIACAGVWEESLLGQESFSTFAEVDTEMMKQIIGRWTQSGRPYIYEYTDEYMRRIDGFQYFKYSISQFRDNNNMYAVFKSKTTGISYFCRGKWHSRYGFQYSASRIVFKGKDRFIVYSKDKPGEIFFVADRVKEEKKS